LRASLLQGRVAFEASYFHMDFDNLVVRENVEGLPALANAGRERFHGTEIEITYRAADNLRLVGTFAHHDATFVDYRRLRPDGSMQQLAGKRLELSPANLGAIGVILEPANGLVASVVASRTGSRYLNKGNTSVAKPYTTLDAGLGYRVARWELRLDGYNLTDRRDPVAESELGDAQFYRLPGRSVLASLTVHLSERSAP
jgi:iron complex outermembrane receptor protein